MRNHDEQCDFCHEEQRQPAPLTRFTASWPRSVIVAGAEVDFYFCGRCIPSSMSDVAQEQRAKELVIEIIDRAGRDEQAALGPPGHG